MYGITLPTPTTLRLRGAGKVQSFEARLNVEETLKIASIMMKQQYNRTHQPMIFHPGDRVLLHLYKGYNVPQALSPKYSD
jgi:hypothetical protein